MYDVITVGSATVDAFAETAEKYFKGKDYSYPVGSKILLQDLHFSVGGGGTNTAVSLARLGLKTAFLGKLGDDDNARTVKEYLKKEKINTSLVVQGHGKTGYSVVLDAKHHDRSILTYKGVNNTLSEGDIDFNKLDAKWVYFSSMVGKAFNTAAKIAKTLRKNGTGIAFNPSSYLTNKGLSYVNRLAKYCDVFVMNMEEAGMLVKGDINETLVKLARYGPQTVIVTDGKNGVYVYNEKNIYYAKPPRAKIDRKSVV